MPVTPGHKSVGPDRAAERAAARRRPPIAELPDDADPFDYIDEKQGEFVRQFVLGGYDVQKATMVAWGLDKPNSAKTRWGNDLLRDEFVLAAIRKMVRDREQELLVSQDRVVLELARIAFADATSFLEQDEDGTVRAIPLGRLSANQRAVISELKVRSIKTSKTNKEGETTETVTVHSHVKLNDKLKALIALGRHLGMWQQDGLPMPDSPLAFPTIDQDGEQQRPANPFAHMAKQYLSHVRPNASGEGNGANGHGD